MPRKETPCVVGFATTLEVRRKSENPGTARSVSSMLMPGTASMAVEFRTVITAGASAEMVPVTVIDSFSGSGLSCCEGCGAEAGGASAAPD